jgi:hypothetical protein
MTAILGRAGLEQFICDFAAGIEAVDRAGAAHGTYQPGIGPFPEKVTIKMVMDHLAARAPDVYAQRSHEVRYPAHRGRCDLCLGVHPDWEWSVEAKMLRLMGDNGKLNDNMLTKILSPYPAHHSALTDCRKLLGSGLSGRFAILIYGFDYAGWPLDPAIDAFELLAGQLVSLGRRFEARFSRLIHPFHQAGRVFGWELMPPRACASASRTRPASRTR